MHSPAAELSRRLAENAEAVCRHYLSNGRRQGHYWIVGDVQNAPGRSMYVLLSGPANGKGAAGKWTDAQSGLHGDLLDMIRESCGLHDFKDVADEARRFLSLPQAEASLPLAARSQAPVPSGSTEAARRLFAMGRLICGTPAETYLRSRRITLFDPVPNLRFHPTCYYRCENGEPALRLPATYGSARWAERSEVAAAGLLGSDGVVLGKLDQTYLRHDGPEHVLCFAPTRSGKGVGLVIPTLLTWPGSAIVHDIKGENWDLTAGFRAKHGRVLRFDPTSMTSAAYNPLLEVRRGEWEVRDVQNVADVLVDPEGSLEKRNHWEKTSHSLLVGAILHVLYAEKDKTLAGVAAFLSDPLRPIEETLEAMMATHHLGNAGPHPVIASTARELLNKSDNERSGVLSTAMSFLGLYRDPVVAHVTRGCDWRIADLIGGEQPSTLYLVVPPSDISRTKPLIRLVLNQIGRRLTEDLHDTKRRHRVLMMLDEFPALGRLDFFESALAFMAGYGIKSFLIAQSLNQIEKAYGQNNAILDNCHVRVSFATNDERTAKRVSDALGTATEMKAMRNYAGHRLAPWLGHLMVSRSETARQLLTPGEIMQLPPDDEIVMVAGSPPIRAKKARYFKDQRFSERVLRPPEPENTGATPKNDPWSSMVKPSATDLKPTANIKAHGDEANAGLRREPELPDHVEIVPEPPMEPAREFEMMMDEEPEETARQRQALRRQMGQVAQQASLDRNDGIDL